MKRYFLILLITAIATVSFGQLKKGKSKYADLKFNKSGKEKDVYLKKQWWLGIKAGPNLSMPVVIEQYAVVSPTNYDPQANRKKYDRFRKPGVQVSLDATFSYKGFSISTQPTFRNIRFDYNNEYHWQSDVEARQFDMYYNQTQRIDYFDLPLIGRYEFRLNTIRPYVQAGVYSSLLLNATKSVEVTKVDYASGSPNSVEDEPIIVGAKDLFAKKHWGFIGGVGAHYNVGNVRLSLDVQYKYGMSNITSTKNRYSNDRLSGVGDAPDDLSLNTLSFSAGCLFPLRFLERGFKSLDKK